MKKPVTKPKKSITIKKKKLLIGLLLVAVLVFAAFKITGAMQQERQFRKDKIRYSQVEKDMQKVYDQIVATYGTPYEAHQLKTCSHVNLKFSQGPLRCGVNYVFTYESSDINRSWENALAISTIVKNAHGNGYDSLNTDINNTKGYLDYGYDRSFVGMHCELSYQYSDASSYKGVVDTEKTLSMYVRSPFASRYIFGCGGGAAKPVYELNKE